VAAGEAEILLHTHLLKLEVDLEEEQQHRSRSAALDLNHLKED
jgi:hypothetical protein